MTASRTHTEPVETIKSFSPSIDRDAEMFRKAKKVRCYNRGTQTIVVVKIGVDDVLHFFIPQTSEVPVTGASSIFTFIEDQRNDMYKEMVEHEIGRDEWFVWETKAKIILREDSFYEFTPHYRVTSTLFILEGVTNSTGEPIKTPIFYVADISTWTQFRMMLLFMAKNEIIRPGTAWTDEGRGMLAFLISKFYSVNADFTASLTGSWVGIKLEMEDGRPSMMPEGYFYKTLAECGALVSLSTLTDDVENSHVITHNPFDEEAYPPRLTRLVHFGIERLVSPDNMDLVEIEIDILASVYKKVVWDGTAELLLVQLCPGVARTKEQVSEELGVDVDDVVFGIVES